MAFPYDAAPMPGPAEDWTDVQDRLLAGDRVAFMKVNRLVTGCLGQLRAYDFRDEWDDLRQEVVMAVVANARAGRLRDPQAFVGYVRIITRNKVMDRLKAKLRHHETQTMPWDEATAGVVEVAAPDDDVAALRAAMDELPVDERRVLDGVYAEGKTYQEVSDATGIPLGTMKRRLRDGLATLRRRLGSG
jgi:RNA polymerase sigma-70 factor (ECF subfamily)